MFSGSPGKYPRTLELNPTIKQNFLTILRAGAFGITDSSIEPMSTFKWSRLEDVGVRLGVAGYVYTGASLLAPDDIYLPADAISEEIEEVYSSSDAHFFNIFKQHRLDHICDQEPHSVTASIITLELLRLIITIGNDIVTSSLPLCGIITLGRFLRKDGDKVDFVKLEEWISRLGIKEIASLEASVLIEVFSFEEEEFPYLQRFYKNATKHYDHLVDNILNGKTTFSSTSRMNIAMLETISYHWGHFTNRITDIEE